MTDTIQPTTNDATASTAEDTVVTSTQNEANLNTTKEDQVAINPEEHGAPVSDTSGPSATPTSALPQSDQDKTNSSSSVGQKEIIQSTTAQKTPYQAEDSLPDMSQKMTTEITNEMQAPRIYDTKEYIVPIKDTMHKRGTAGAIIAGIVSAGIMLLLVILAAYWLI